MLIGGVDSCSACAEHSDDVVMSVKRRQMKGRVALARGIQMCVSGLPPLCGVCEGLLCR